MPSLPSGVLVLVGLAGAFRRPAALALLVCVLLPSAGAAPAARPLRVGVPDGSEPLSFLDAQGQPTGFMPDLLREIERVSGQRIEIVCHWWRINLPAFREHKLDAIGNIASNDSEFGGWDLSIAAVSFRGVTYSRPDQPRLRSVADLRGKRLGVVRSTRAAAHALEHLQWGATIISFDSITELINATARNECDAAFLTSVLSTKVADDRGLRKDLIEDVVHRFHFVFQPGSREELRLFNEAIATLKHDGTYDRLHARWIGPVEPRPIRLTDLQPYVLPMGGGLLLVLAAFLWQRRLLRRIERHADQLRQSRLELEQANIKLEAAIQEANRLAQAADQASQAKSRFLAMMSHELRTPMNAVIGMADLLERSPLTAEQREMLRTISGGAENLLALINDILDLSRIEAGRLRLDPADFDLRRVLTETVALLAPRAREKQLRLTCDFPDAPDHFLCGDAGRVRQALTNLIGNAIKFTDQGEVSVQARVVAQSPGQVRVRMAVRDTGIGIPREAQGRLFQPFVQADTTHTRRFGGTGLGLAITRQLVEAMGGTLGLESSPGQGSLFWLELEFPRRGPLPSTQPVPAVAREPATPATKRPLRLLVAEDNPTNQVVIRGMLHRLGHRSEVVGDGETCLVRLASETFDAVLMDCQMPVLDGFATTERIRSGRVPGVNPGIPIIALTAYARREDRDRCLAAGMNDYLAKPLRVAAINEALARQGLHETAASAATAQPNSDVPPGFDAAQFESLCELPGRTHSNLRDEVIDLLLREVPMTLQQLADRRAAGDAPEIARLSHRLAGSFAHLGATRLRTIADKLDHAARQTDWLETDRQLRELPAEWAMARSHLIAVGSRP